jgi:hypothetical protein
MSLQFGGAFVKRPFSMGERRLRVGDMLTAAELMAIPVNNRRALIDNKQLETFPVAQTSSERHVVHIGRGLYDVFLGTKLTAEPLSKEEAEALAASPAN